MYSSKMQQPFSGSIPFPVTFPALAGRVFRPVILPAESFRSRPPPAATRRLFVENMAAEDLREIPPVSSAAPVKTPDQLNEPSAFP